jgi:hypothetical protein
VPDIVNRSILGGEGSNVVGSMLALLLTFTSLYWGCYRHPSESFIFGWFLALALFLIIVAIVIALVGPVVGVGFGLVHCSITRGLGHREALTHDVLESGLLAMARGWVIAIGNCAVGSPLWLGTVGDGSVGCEYFLLVGLALAAVVISSGEVGDGIVHCLVRFGLVFPILHGFIKNSTYSEDLD